MSNPVPDKLSIVIPVYNEERTLELLLQKVAAVQFPVPREIIIVNDGSVDSSWEIAQKFAAARPEIEIKLLVRENGGKGAAVRDGIKASTGSVLIIQDGDLEYDPEDIKSCIAPILTGTSDVIYGSRIRRKGNVCSSWRFYLGGLAVTWFMNILFFKHLTDEPTCYKTFRGDLIRSLEYENDDFGWEPEVTAKLFRLGYTIEEVPVSYIPRHWAEGKKIRWHDGVKAFAITLKWRFKSMKKFRHLARKKNGVTAEFIQ